MTSIVASVSILGGIVAVAAILMIIVLSRSIVSTRLPAVRPLFLERFRRHRDVRAIRRYIQLVWWTYWVG